MYIHNIKLSVAVDHPRLTFPLVDCPCLQTHYKDIYTSVSSWAALGGDCCLETNIGGAVGRG